MPKKGSKAVADSGPMPLAKEGVRKAPGSKKQAQSKSAKAGLTFPVARINRRLCENKLTKRVGAGAPIYMTAVVEYFAAELLEVAINQMKGTGEKRSRLTPADVLQGVRNDVALNKASNGLRVMVGDKAKDTSELITSKSDADIKLYGKMCDVDWFEYNPEHTVAANWKRFNEEKEQQEQEQS